MAAQAVIVFLVVARFFPKKYKKTVIDFFSKRAILFAFLVSLAAALGSLFYSEIAGYTPCKLCWYQRIFMYPQTLLFAIALWKKDKGIVKYSLGMSIAGGLLALYHYLLQTGVVSGQSCGVVGYSASCSQRFVMEYGYMTIPLMSLTAFVLIIALLLTVKKSQSRAK